MKTLTTTERTDAIIEIRTTQEAISFLKDLVTIPNAYYLRDMNQFIVIRFSRKIIKKKVFKELSTFLSNPDRINSL